MKCIYCQSDMRHGSAPFHIDRKGVHLSLDDLPAWVCNQCGEAYFEEAEVNSIQAIIREVEKHSPTGENGVRQAEVIPSEVKDFFHYYV